MSYIHACACMDTRTHTTHACTHTHTPTTHSLIHSLAHSFTHLLAPSLCWETPENKFVCCYPSLYPKFCDTWNTLCFTRFQLTVPTTDRRYQSQLTFKTMILSFVVLEIHCASPVFSWRCTRQTDANPSWHSKPWSWRWGRVFSSTSGCPRWIVYSLLASRRVCLACLLFLILQAGSWPFLLDYCSMFLRQYPLLSLSVLDISSVGSWSSCGMGMCVCICMYVCVCVHMYVCVCVCVDRMILKYALCWHIHKSVHPVLCQCRHAHICMHVCTHARTHMHAHTHTDLTASLSAYSLFDINVTPS